MAGPDKMIVANQAEESVELRCAGRVTADMTTDQFDHWSWLLKQR